MPRPVTALFIWAISGLDGVRQIGAAGAGEARALIVAMTAASRSCSTPALLAVRS
jgi:hypothetical protein